MTGNRVETGDYRLEFCSIAGNGTDSEQKPSSMLLSKSLTYNIRTIII